MVLEMKKVAIMTWCYDNGPVNYGQILQCYALQETIKKLGFEVRIIKYRKPRDFEDIDELPEMGNLREKYEYSFRNEYVEKQINRDVARFLDFIYGYINTTPQCYTEQDLKKVTQDVDFVVLGSDQLWNPLWFDEATLLKFCESKKRISYATSGLLYMDKKAENTVRKIAEGIEWFDAVSVREPISAKLLSEHSNKKVVDVLDPTLLLDLSEWDAICSERLLEEPYIFCYFLGDIQPHKHLIKHAASIRGIKKIVYIQKPWISEHFNKGSSFVKCDYAGPREFVSLIKYSDAVLTDSFHAVCFSALYEKDFYQFKRAYDQERVADNNRTAKVCNILGIKERFITGKADFEKLSHIDYGCGKNRLEEYKRSSLDFLIQNLK